MSEGKSLTWTVMPRVPEGTDSLRTPSRGAPVTKHVSTFFRCDQDGCLITTQRLSLTDANEIARGYGWLIEGGLDLCPSHNPKLWAGYQRHLVTAGRLVVLVDGVEHGITPEGSGDGPWFLVCDRHGTSLGGSDRRRLVGRLRVPEEWCERCHEEDRFVGS